MNQDPSKMSLDSRFRKENSKYPIYIYDLNGDPAVFELKDYETKAFYINSETYSIIETFGEENSGDMLSSGEVQALILESVEGSKVKITSEGFFGAVIEIVN